MASYAIKLHEGCWVADWDGDPGRTLKIHNARIFDSKEEAEKELERIRNEYSQYGWEDAELIPVINFYYK